MKKTIFSGIQPSGVVHIGNYFGAIKQWVEMQNEADFSVFCIVDLHAITVPQDPTELKENIYKMAALYLAAGIDPQKSALFVQSSRPEHTELSWLLNCNTTMGELNRMTQFKEKSESKKDSVSAGLFNYPVLMAADILLYGATHVPVGEDQKQHVELTRDVAERFNAKYGQCFTIPEPIIKNTSARIMGLDNPLKKMSKSAASSNNYIAISDSADEISSKIKKAVTDSGQGITKDKDKPAISNLINIYAEATGMSVEDIEKKYSGKGYGDFKKELADVLIAYLEPIQNEYNRILQDKTALTQILTDGSSKIAGIAQATVSSVKEAIGLGL
ncbi:MAG: Tryptophan--tRNA ligase [bacterium ADurb.Bin212]|nr:MAG: Tryptophan--tRNA ligase [bacterium ADurb.Bin212]